MIDLNLWPRNDGDSTAVQDPLIDLRGYDNAGQPLPMEPALRGQSNFYHSKDPYAPISVARTPYIPPFHFYGTVRAPGFKEQAFQFDWDGKASKDVEVRMVPGFRRPAAKAHSQLPDWDQSDSGGQVHTVPPPEGKHPAHFADPLFMRADFNGVCIDLARFGLQIDFNHNWLVGANSTPFNMIMTPMLIMYERKVQDAVFTEHAERGYDDFIFAADGWNMDVNGRAYSPADIVAWAKVIRSWGFRPTYWGRTVKDDPYLKALVDAHAINLAILGEEMDSRIPEPKAEMLEDLIDNNLAIADGLPCGVHFTSSYPHGYPKDTLITDWSKYDGRLHLYWQADQNDSAGTQGAMSFYARKRMMGLGDGAVGPGAPNSRFIAFETMASAQLPGECTEEYGCLRSLELQNCPNGGVPGMSGVSGSGNGLREHNGDPF